MNTAPTPTLASPQAEQRIKMTYEEFLAWANEDVHAEWVDGEAIIFMPPTIRHQDVAGFLFTLLRLFVDFFHLGKVLSAPCEMKLGPDGPSREPDILFVARENLGRLTEARLVGPADLVVEIISDESVGRDRGHKFYEYQAAGIREYWLFDYRAGKERADFWVLDEARRYQPMRVDADGIYRSMVIAGFWLQAGWLSAEALPDSLQAFAAIAGFPAEVVAALRELAARGASASQP